MTNHSTHTSHAAPADRTTMSVDEHAAHGGAPRDTGGHDEHAGHGGGGGGHAGHADMFRMLFWRNLALAIPVLVFSEQVQ